MSKKFFLAALLAFSVGCGSTTGTGTADPSEAPEGAGEYNYAKLQTRSLDDMNGVVRRQIVKAKKFNNEDDQESAVAALQAAAQYVLSRPDRDNLVAKVIAPLRTELKEMDQLESVLRNIVSTAMKGLDNTSLRPSDRATYYFVLVNFMAEFKPDLKMNAKIRPIYESIEKAKIKIDGKVQNELTLRAMVGRSKSPSELAAKVLQSVKTKSVKYEEPQDGLERTDE